MDVFEKKWGLLTWAFLGAILMIVIRYIIDYFGYDVIPINALLGALVSGVVFTIAMILTGTLSDYKESEKVPSDLVAAIKALYFDGNLIPDDYIHKNAYQGAVICLKDAIVYQLTNGTWDMKQINKMILGVNEEITSMHKAGIPINIVIKMRSEMGNIDKICHRVYQIKDTDFIPAAYAIAESAIGFMLIVLAFVKSDSIFDTIGVAVLTMLVLGLLLLIKDMDDPFEAPGAGFADVDMFQVYEIEDYLV